MSNVELKGLVGLRKLNTLISNSENFHIPDMVRGNIENLSIELLSPGKFQPRKQWNNQELIELSDSIKTHGVIQPLIARKLTEGRYEIIAGERRCRAAKLAGLKHLPVIVHDVNDSTALAFSLIENIQRADLNPMEEALAYVRFKDEFAMTHNDIAQVIGRSRTYVTNIMRLVSLSEPVKKFLEEGRLDAGHARALLTLDAEHQINIANEIVGLQLTVRQTEKLVKQGVKKTQSNSRADGEKLNLWCEELTKIFSSKVTIRTNGKEGYLIALHVKSEEEINWLIEHACFKN